MSCQNLCQTLECAFKLKVNLFNELLNQQCTAGDNQIFIPEKIRFETEKGLSTFDICKGNIAKLMTPFLS